MQERKKARSLFCSVKTQTCLLYYHVEMNAEKEKPPKKRREKQFERNLMTHGHSPTVTRPGGTPHLHQCSGHQSDRSNFTTSSKASRQRAASSFPGRGKGRLAYPPYPKW